MIDLNDLQNILKQHAKDLYAKISEIAEEDLKKLISTGIAPSKIIIKRYADTDSYEVLIDRVPVVKRRFRIDNSIQHTRVTEKHHLVTTIDTWLIPIKEETE